VTSAFFDSFDFGARVNVQRREVRWCLRVVVFDFGSVGAGVVVPDGTEAPPVPPFGLVGERVAAGGTGAWAAVEVVVVAVVGGGVVGAGVAVGAAVTGTGVVVVVSDAGVVVVVVAGVVVVVVVGAAALVSGVVAVWPVVAVAAGLLGAVSATAAVAGMDATATPAAKAAARRRALDANAPSAAGPRSATEIAASDFGRGRAMATPSEARSMSWASGSSNTSSGTANRARQSTYPPRRSGTAPGIGRVPSARNRWVQLRNAG
jgi:hypothetical protein